MSAGLEGDTILALRKLRRHLTVWRLLTVVGFALAIFMTVRDDAGLSSGPHVAAVEVEGVILKDPDMLVMFEEIADDPDVQALIVNISSPGGTFGGGEAYFKVLRQISDSKPVVAIMGDLATSGAYMTAIAADRIYASRGTITGSVGVIMQSANITGLLDKLGIEPEIIKSGPAKAVPNPMEELSPDSRAQLQGIIDELQGMFLQMVSDRRGKSVAELNAVIGDGRILTGTAAADAGLIDEVGDENDARLWLQSAHDVSTELPVIEWSIEDPIDWWREAGTSLSTTIFGKSLLPERLRLDGILALWHPSLND